MKPAAQKYTSLQQNSGGCKQKSEEITFQKKTVRIFSVKISKKKRKKKKLSKKTTKFVSFRSRKMHSDINDTNDSKGEGDEPRRRALISSCSSLSL